MQAQLCLLHGETCLFGDLIFPSIQWGAQRNLKAERLQALGWMDSWGEGLTSRAGNREVFASSSEEYMVPGGLPRGGKVKKSLGELDKQERESSFSCGKRCDPELPLSGPLSP